MSDRKLRFAIEQLTTRWEMEEERMRHQISDDIFRQIMNEGVARKLRVRRMELLDVLNQEGGGK